MRAINLLWCRAGCASRVSLLSGPRRGWLLSILRHEGLSLLRQGAGAQESAGDNQLWSTSGTLIDSIHGQRNPHPKRGELGTDNGAIGSYRQIAIAIESEAGDSLTYRSKRIFA